MVLFAWCPTAIYYFDALGAAGAAPRLVVTGTGLSAEAPLARACAQAGVRLERQDDAGASALLHQLAEAAPDLLLVAGWPRRLGAELLAIPRLGALNLHPSLLPHYRGRHPLYWALLRGEPRVGLSVHHITADIDRGPVLLQRAVDVSPHATSESLAHDVDRAGAELIPEILSLARGAKLPPGTPQAAGSDFPPVRPEHGNLDWTRPGPEVERHFRACTGVVRPYTLWQGMKLVPRTLCRARCASTAAPGTILDIDTAGVTIAAASGTPALRVARFLFLEREVDAADLARKLSLSVGAEFSSDALCAPG